MCRFFSAALSLLPAALLWVFSFPAFSSPASANLQIYRNGMLGDAPESVWEEGNLNTNLANYFEGGVVPFRIVFDSLAIGSTHVVTIEWSYASLDGGLRSPT